MPYLQGPERRSELRRACNNAAAELTIIDSSTSTVTSIQAMIVDVSKSGLKLVASTRTSRGQQVRVKMDKLIAFGDIRHCAARGSTFEMGLSISNVVAPRGRCDRLSEEQIESLVLGKGLSCAKKMYAHFHVSHCQPCEEYFRANEQFFAYRVSGSAQGNIHL